MNKKFSRITAFFMAILLVLTFVPLGSVKAESGYTKVTGDLTSGKYVLVFKDGMAPTFLDGTWVLSEPVTKENGSLTQVSTNTIWTLTVNGTKVAIEDSKGVYLAPKGAASNGILSSETPYDWDLEVLDDGTFAFTAMDAEGSYQLAANHNFEDKLRAYKVTSINSGYSASFELYAVEEGAEPTDPVVPEDPEPEVPAEISGDVAIYLPKDGTAISNVANGTRLEAQAVTKVDGKVEATEETTFTVEKVAENEYRFVNNGKYLTTGETGNSLTLQEEPTDLTLWNLESTEGGVLIKSKVANFNGKAQYIEYYNGFTVYGLNTSNLPIYTFEILPVVSTVPEDPVEPVDPNPTEISGDVLIYYPKDNNAISTIVNETNNKKLDPGRALIIDEVAHATEQTLFTVEKVAENEYRFKNKDSYLTTGETGNSLTMETEATDYNVWILEETEGGVLIKNKAAKFNDKPQYIEFYNGFTVYGLNQTNLPIYTFQIIPAILSDPVVPTDPYVGEKVMYYPKESLAVTSLAEGSKLSGKAVTLNEAKDAVTIAEDTMLFTVEKTDKGYTFSQNDLYLTTKATGGSLTLGALDDYSYWSIEEVEGGILIKNNLAAYGTSAQYIEYYNGFTTYSYKETTKDIFTFQLLNAEEVKDTDPISDVEGLNIEANPISGANVVKGQPIELRAANETKVYYTMTTDGSEPQAPVAGNADQLYSEPIIVSETPAKGSPIKISAIAVSVDENGEQVVGQVYTFVYYGPSMISDYGLYFGQMHNHTTLSDGAGTIEQAYDYASKVPGLDYIIITDHSNSFEGREITNIDSSKSMLPAHGTTHMGDEDAEQVNEAWRRGRQAARDITAKEGDFVGLYAFEQTWSGGSPGHMNTYNSKGFETRESDEFRLKGTNTPLEALRNYYNRLKENPETISMFNHPGATFGDFLDFDLFDDEIDKLITLIEVGNGEGEVGSSFYWPSYEYYTRALDKGWHLAPTNGQDVHKGVWGNSNSTRTVLLADGLSEDSIYDAMRNYRVYSTEDEDLEILYSLNENAMGSILSDQKSINIKVDINDPTDSADMKLEIVVNGGQVVDTKTLSGGKGIVEFTDVTNGFGYYFVRVTQADGQIAVTAPVWVGESIAAGLTGTTTSVALPVKDDVIDISSQIYNNEGKDLVVKSLTYTFQGEDTPFHTANPADIGTDGVIKAGQVEYKFDQLLEKAGTYNVNVELVAEINGQEYTFTDVMNLNITDPSIVTKVLVDGSHYNDYVTGYYGGNMTNLAKLAAKYNIQVKTMMPGHEWTEADLEGVTMVIAPSPLKRGNSVTPGGVPTAYGDTFIQLMNKFVNDGGTLVVNGLADYQDSSLPYTTYEQALRLLSGVGSTMKINDDELIDNELNGGQNYRLYFNKFNLGSGDAYVEDILTGVDASDKNGSYSSYSGASVDPGNGTPVVFGHDSTYSINSRTPNQGHDVPVTSASVEHTEDQMVVKKGDVVALATEQVGQGRVIVSGTVFMSNFDVNEDGTGYANSVITKNILESIKKPLVISTIEEARQGQPGDVFTVQGTVAVGTVDPNNAFFNTTYIQDETGNGINVFPIDDNTLNIGDRIQITGYISDYLGEPQLQIINYSKLDETAEVVITDATTEYAADFDNNFGRLVRIKGKVVDYSLAVGKVQDIYVEDETGVKARVFIDGYIGYSDDTSDILEDFIEVGAEIEAIGFVSRDAVDYRLRVRDRSEILLITPAEDPTIETKAGYPHAKLAVRPEPNSSELLGVLDINEFVEGELVGNWIKFNYDGKEAYVAAKYIHPNKLVQNMYPHNKLAIRPEPNSTELIGMLNINEPVSGELINDYWVKTTYNNKEAYVAYKFLHEEPLRLTGYMQATIVVRSRIGGQIIGTIDKGTYVKDALVVYQNNNWLQIEFNGQKAYIAAKYLGDQVQTQSRIFTVNGYMRMAPYSGAATMGIAKKGLRVKATDLGAWIKFEYNGKTVYSAKFLTEIVK